jgi:uncharacterized membrane protein YhaH (DUF805 family)
MARALVILACLLLVVPGLFIAAKGLHAIRRRQALVQGRTVTGAQAIFAGLILLGWAAGMLGFAALVLAKQLSR